ncbi:hypothetical protein [Leptotrichia trevisanii]|uniref:hypothetical protein n=1 Tax=Leptotrichia trevisanii TaxID=109328 RepID=UPI0026F191D7|nr:hypothetical protein [Leptotrichia trevisanii]
MGMISPIELNRRVRKSNHRTELLGKIQIYFENKKEDRTYILVKSIEMTIENAMMEHSTLNMTFSVILSDIYTINKIEEIQKNKSLLYNDKVYIGVDVKDGKKLFYGIVESLEITDSKRKFVLKASSISKLIDRFPQFIDFKTGYSIEFFLAKMERKIQKYLSNEAKNTDEKTKLSKIFFDIRNKRFEFLNVMKYDPILMLNTTYWKFLKNFLYLESLKIPVYVNGNSIVIGFSKEDEEQKKKEGSKKLKLSFKENEIRDYKEIGEYYTGYCIFKSKIEISSYVGTRYYYESDTLDGIVNKLKVEPEKKPLIQLVGTVESVETVEKIDSFINEKKQLLINQNKILEEKKIRLNEEKQMLNNEITRLNEEVIELQEEKNSETKDIKNQWLKNRLEQIGMNEKEYNKLSEEEKAMQKNKGRLVKIEEELQFIDGLIEDNNKFLQKEIEKSNYLGVRVNFDEILKNMGSRVNNDSYRQNIEGVENGVYSAENMGNEEEIEVSETTDTKAVKSDENIQNFGTEENKISENSNIATIEKKSSEENIMKKKIKVEKEYFYAFEILSNSGYSKGNSTTSKPQVGEQIVVNITETASYVNGTLETSNKDNIMNEIIKINASNMNIKVDEKAQIEATSDVEIKATNVSYDVSE